MGGNSKYVFLAREWESERAGENLAKFKVPITLVKVLGVEQNEYVKKLPLK